MFLEHRGRDFGAEIRIGQLGPNLDEFGFDLGDFLAQSFAFRRDIDQPFQRQEQLTERS